MPVPRPTSHPSPAFFSLASRTLKPLSIYRELTYKETTVREDIKPSITKASTLDPDFRILVFKDAKGISAGNTIVLGLGLLDERRVMQAALEKRKKTL